MSNIKLTNQNYCATVVEIKTLVPLENCNNVQAAIIMGNQVIVGKDVQIGDVGLFFPVECELSKEYLRSNSLYRDKTLNVDTNKGGYFELNGGIRCVKFRGNKSEGLFMPLESLDFITKDYPELNTEFNIINNIEKIITRQAESFIKTKCIFLYTITKNFDIILTKAINKIFNYSKILSTCIFFFIINTNFFKGDKIWIKISKII